MSYILISLASIGLFVLAIILHELGHYAYFVYKLKKRVTITFKYTKKGYKLTVGTPKDYVGLKRKALVGIYASGILTGFIPIAITAVSIWPFSVFIFPYLVGCRKDLKNIYKLFKK